MTQKASIAYFSAEYGLSDTLPIYSGGLGILSGDHVKAASDLNLNFHGVGLLYQLGYFQQYLNMDGWQQDFYQVNDFHNMQVQEVKRARRRPAGDRTGFPRPQGRAQGLADQGRPGLHPHARFQP